LGFSFLPLPLLITNSTNEGHLRTNRKRPVSPHLRNVSSIVFYSPFLLRRAQKHDRRKARPRNEMLRGGKPERLTPSQVCTKKKRGERVMKYLVKLRISTPERMKFIYTEDKTKGKKTSMCVGNNRRAKQHARYSRLEKRKQNHRSEVKPRKVDKPEIPYIYVYTKKQKTCGATPLLEVFKNTYWQ
jgi:hypothetical protein